MSSPYPNENWVSVPAHELIEAIAAKLLTQDEARQVYWSQFRGLVQQAATTAPPIQAAA